MLVSRVLVRPEVAGWHSVLVLVAVLLLTTLAGIILLHRRQLDRQG